MISQLQSVLLPSMMRYSKQKMLLVYHAVAGALQTGGVVELRGDAGELGSMTEIFFKFSTLTHVLLMFFYFRPLRSLIFYHRKRWFYKFTVL